MRLVAQLCVQTQEWVPDGGLSTCASRRSPPSVRTLSWLGLDRDLTTSKWPTPTSPQGSASRPHFYFSCRHQGIPGVAAEILPQPTISQADGKKLVVVPATADSFRATVSALISLNGKNGVSYHTYWIPEDRCVRLLIKNLGRMPESDMLEDLGSLDIHVQGVMQIRSCRRDQDPVKDCPPTPHFIVSMTRGPEVSKVRALIELCGLRVSVETFVAPKSPVPCKRCQHFGHKQRNCEHAPRCVACGVSHVSVDCPARPVQPLCCICGGNHTANYRSCVKWKVAKGALVKQAPALVCRTDATSHPAASKVKRTGSCAEQKDLGEGWNHVVRGGRVVKASSPSPLPKSPLNQSLRQPKCPKLLPL